MNRNFSQKLLHLLTVFAFAVGSFFISSVSANAQNGVLVEGILGIIADEIAAETRDTNAIPNAPPSNSQRSVSVKIVSIRADRTTFGVGADEVFVIDSTGRRAPRNTSNYRTMNVGDAWTPGANFSSKGSLRLELREWDTIGSSDLIGRINVNANQNSGRYTVNLSGDGSLYRVVYDLTVSGQTGNQGGNNTPAPSTPQPPAQPPRVWGAYGQGSNVSVADCNNDCEEDLGLVMLCTGQGRAAELSVPWAAQENGQRGQNLTMTVTVGSQRFTYNAQLSGAGLVGHVPSFLVQPNDPLIAALQAGNSVSFSTPFSGAVIGLRGSRVALDRFKAECGWNRVAATPTPPAPTPTPPAPTPPVMPTPTPEPAPQDTGPFWFTSQYENFETGEPIVALTLGIPETDAVGINAICLMNGSGMIDIDFMVDFGTYPIGSSVPMLVQLGDVVHQFDGVVFGDSSEWAGVTTKVRSDHPFWTDLQNAQQQFTYGVGGQAAQFGIIDAASIAVPRFMSSCPLPTDMVMPMPNTPAPIMPMPSTPTPSNPTPVAATGTLDFLCDDNSRLRVALTTAGSVTIANVFQKGQQFDLVQVPTAIGQKFSNGEATLNLSGSTAQFAAGQTARFCQAQ